MNLSAPTCRWEQMQIFSKHTHTHTHKHTHTHTHMCKGTLKEASRDKQTPSHGTVHHQVEEDPTELKAALVLKQSSGWVLLFDNCCKTAFNGEGPTEPSGAASPHKPLLRAQPTFHVFSSRDHTLPLCLIKALKLHECVSAHESVSVLACLHVQIRVYMFIWPPWATHTHTHILEREYEKKQTSKAEILDVPKALRKMFLPHTLKLRTLCEPHLIMNFIINKRSWGDQ